MSEIKAYNEKSAKQLVISENAPINFIKNPNTGKLFFACGSKKGYVSPNVEKNLTTLGLDDIKYAEVSINGGAPVPTLMIVGNSDANVTKSLGADLLR